MRSRREPRAHRYCFPEDPLALPTRPGQLFARQSPRQSPRLQNKRAHRELDVHVTHRRACLPRTPGLRAWDAAGGSPGASRDSRSPGRGLAPTLPGGARANSRLGSQAWGRTGTRWPTRASTCSRADAVGGAQGAWPPEEGLLGRGLLWNEEHKPPVWRYPGLPHLHQGPSTLPATEPRERS